MSEVSSLSGFQGTYITVDVKGVLWLSIAYLLSLLDRIDTDEWLIDFGKGRREECCDRSDAVERERRMHENSVLTHNLVFTDFKTPHTSGMHTKQPSGAVP